MLHVDSLLLKPENVATFYRNFLDIYRLFLIDTGWGTKVIARRGQGSGRMSYLKDLPRRAKNQFREGTTPKPKTRKAK